MLQPLFPTVGASKCASAENAAGNFWWRSELAETALLYFLYLLLGHDLIVCRWSGRSWLRRIFSILSWWDQRCSQGMHSTEMLCKEILSIEVVVDRVVDPWRRRAHVASPKSKLYMLSAYVPLPLILRGKSRAAVVLGKAARERTRAGSRCPTLCRPWRWRDRLRRSGQRKLRFRVPGLRSFNFDGLQVRSIRLGLREDRGMVLLDRRRFVLIFLLCWDGLG
jgi:hypothetical protein